jgi:beta-lactamase class A
VAASIDNRRQPENSQLERQQQRLRLRRRQWRTLQKQTFGQEVTRTSYQPPKRSLRPSQPSGNQPVPMPTHSPSELPRQLHPRQTGRQSPFSVRSHLRSVPEIPPQRPSATAHRSTFLQNSEPKEDRVRESGYGREEQASAPTTRINPWQVQPKSTFSRPPVSPAGSQNPQFLESVRGMKRRDRIESPTFPPIKPLPNSSKRRRDSNQPRTAAKVAPPDRDGKSSGKRVKQKVVSPTPPSQSNRAVRRPKKRRIHPLVYIIRMLILGIGIGAIAGTLLSALDPATQASGKANEPVKRPAQESPKPVTRVTPLALNQEILPLKSQVQSLVANNPKLQPGVFIVDLDTGGYLDLGSQTTLPAASTIKLPILVALFQDVDEGKVRLDETLTLQSEMIATGSGDLQYKPVGTKLTVLELATKMIAISDNTATNILIARLGGAEALSQRFRSWGLTKTVLRNVLPDLNGTNLTTPQELTTLMSMVHQGQLVSLRSRDRILDIMRRNQIDTLLPQGLGPGAIIAHKTGNIGTLLADVGLVNMPTGKSYIICVMVKRPFDDSSAQDLIRKISQTTYNYFNQSLGGSNTTSMPLGNSVIDNRALASSKASE